MLKPNTAARVVMRKRSIQRYWKSDRLEECSYRMITDTNWVRE